MKNIERDMNRGFGQPVIKGRRLTVFNVLSNALNNENLIEYLDEFGLSMEEMKDAIVYCKIRECKVIKSRFDHYCDGCILRSISEGWEFSKDDFIEIDGISISKDGKTFFLGSINEFEDSEFGVIGWLLAEMLEKRWFT